MMTTSELAVVASRIGVVTGDAAPASARHESVAAHLLAGHIASGDGHAAHMFLYGLEHRTIPGNVDPWDLLRELCDRLAAAGTR